MVGPHPGTRSCGCSLLSGGGRKLLRLGCQGTAGQGATGGKMGLGCSQNGRSTL